MRIRLHFFLVLCIQSWLCTWAMLSKRGNFVEKEGCQVPNAKRLKFNIADLLMTGDISAQRARALAEDAQQSKPEHLEDIVRCGARGKHPGNIFRDVVRKLMKRRDWPSFYYAPIRVFDLASQSIKVVSIPMLLPHEVIHCFAFHAQDQRAILQQDRLTTDAKAHLAYCAKQLGTQASELLYLGLWGDGVPFNWDRSQSMELFTLSLPGLSAPWDALRVPLAGVNRKFLVKQATLDDLCDVLAWSFQQLALGIFPLARHDKSAFIDTDNHRRKQAGKPLLLRAILGEVRGDWVFYKACFRFPQHNERRGICWRCQADPSNFRDVSSSASWRSNRLDHYGLLQRFREDGILLSPLFKCPFLKADRFLVDWLHTMDKGVASDFLASFVSMSWTRCQAPMIHNDASHCSGRSTCTTGLIL